VTAASPVNAGGEVEVTVTAGGVKVRQTASASATTRGATATTVEEKSVTRPSATGTENSAPSGGGFDFKRLASRAGDNWPVLLLFGAAGIVLCALPGPLKNVKLGACLIAVGVAGYFAGEYIPALLVVAVVVVAGYAAYQVWQQRQAAASKAAAFQQTINGVEAFKSSLLNQPNGAALWEQLKASLRAEQDKATQAAVRESQGK
jgi:hypothetical protein